MRKLLGFVLLVPSLASSAPQEPPLSATPRPAIIPPDAVTEKQTVFVTVLTYNIKGLPWPLAKRRNQLHAIARQLRQWQEAGQAPDIILVQESFTTKSYAIGEWAGYPYRIRGPGRKDSGGHLSSLAHARFLAERNFFVGERFRERLTGSGLAVFSRWPIVAAKREAFPREACAGNDCVANKGILAAQIAVPGLPMPLTVLTTHLNARLTTWVSSERSLYAYRIQLAQLVRAMDTEASGNPIIMGGDLNIRMAPPRISALSEALASKYPLTRQYCAQHGCGAVIPDHWGTYQDHQAFLGTERVRITPVWHRALFDGTPEGGAVLSDHQGYLVKYRVTLTPAAEASQQSALDPSPPAM